MMFLHNKSVVSTLQRAGKLLTTVCVLLGLIMSSVHAVDARIWKDATGKHEIDAEFVKFENGKAHLKTAAGKQMAVSLSKLSREDQEFVRAELRKLRKAEGEDVKPRRRVRKQAKATPLLELDSTETVKPTTYNSRNFILHTDVTPPEAKVVLGSLETVLANMEAYWGQRIKGRIKCFVIRDLEGWPLDSLDPDGVAKVQRREGVTLTLTRTISGKEGKEETTKLVGAKSVVYAYADRGIAQHEAVHAYCGQTFGRTGPTWYSEGMAEMGQYWVKGSRAVNTPQAVVEFFQRAPHRQAIDIVNEEQITGDSWENYTRRWALCHLLNHNPNYSARFRLIGQAIVDGQNINYTELFGARADQIEFEYRFFVKHIGIGYRADLCSWDWEARFLPLTTARIKSVKISALRGWQPSGAALTADQKYQYSTKGTWSTGNGEPVDAKGHQDGGGRLVGVLMQDFQLGEPFELGNHGTFTAPADGQLYLRCRDAWHEIADNDGTILVRLKGFDRDDPLEKLAE
jgi:hypothetical protein